MSRIKTLLLIILLSVTGYLFTENIKLEAQGTLPKIKKGAPLPANLFIELAKIVNPTVVNISTTQLPKQNLPQYYRDPFFEMFNPFMRPRQQRPSQSLGTGFIIRKDGLIITNNHVIDKADIVKVQLSETSTELYEAEVIGKDARTDIALIKITTKKNLPVATLGTSSNLQVGEWVAAFGNPFGHGHTMTKGIISAIGREIDELNRFPFLQTDASINPGNSGGPLVNARGEVIGVNTAVDARAQGIGFAIPIDNVKSILKTLEKEGRIKRAFLGVSLANIADPRIAQSLNLKTTEGALIEHVYTGSPADKAGVEPYDFVTRIEKTKVTNSQELVRAIADEPVGKSVKLVVIRNGKEKTLSVKLEQHPEDKKLGKRSNKKKTYAGQKAPFNLGFKIASYNSRLRKAFNLPVIRRPRPVVISISPGSPASRSGLVEGDIILDINRTPVSTSKSALKAFKKEFNVLRILRGNRSTFIYLRN